MDTEYDIWYKCNIIKALINFVILDSMNRIHFFFICCFALTLTSIILSGIAPKSLKGEDILS
jgi:hypothetical protein